MNTQESLWGRREDHRAASPGTKLNLNQVRNKDTYFLLVPPKSWEDPLGCELLRDLGGHKKTLPQLGDPGLETQWEQGEAGGTGG